jgi:hypothetical protein
MDTADLLKMDKANGVGTGTMILTHNLSQLKLVSTGTSGNLILQNTNASNGCLIDFWDSSSVSVASIQTGHVSRTINILTGTSTAMTIGTTLINCLKPTQITGTLTMVAGGLSPIDMSGNDITKVSNINSNGTNALNLQHNSIAKIKVDSSGLTMQNSGNINMNNGTISNTTITTPTITAPIQTSTSSSYSSINSNSQNIGYTISGSYTPSSTHTLNSSTYYNMLNTNGKITIPAGVWFVSGWMEVVCSASGAGTHYWLDLFITNVNTNTIWTAFPSLRSKQRFGGATFTNGYTGTGNVSNIITITAQTDLYLWSVQNYSNYSWNLTKAELRATRIA